MNYKELKFAYFAKAKKDRIFVYHFNSDVVKVLDSDFNEVGDFGYNVENDHENFIEAIDYFFAYEKSLPLF